MGKGSVNNSSDCETLNFDDPSICTNCTDKLDSKCYVLCANAQCKNPQIRLCLFCFSCSVEVRNHKKNHSYRVFNSGGLTLFAPSASRPLSFPVWGCKEEESLLETVERYNLGNWEDAVKLVGAGERSSLDAKLHYDKYYIHGRIGQGTLSPTKLPSSCVDHSVRGTPGPALDGLMSPAIEGVSQKLSVFSTPLRKSRTVSSDTSSNQALSISCSSSIPAWFSACQASPPVKISTLKQNPDDLKLIAYMPHRDDFEKEWNNDAEASIAALMPMSSEDPDSELERRLQFAVVDAYMDQVRERRRRKLLARDYDLVPKFLKEQKPKLHARSGMVAPIQFRALLKEERELAEELRKFAQFMKKDEYTALVAGVVKQRYLMERIKQMQKLKRKGVKKLDVKLKSFDVSNLPLSQTGQNGVLKKRRRKTRLRFSQGQQKSVSRFIRWRKYIARQGEVDSRCGD